MKQKKCKSCGQKFQLFNSLQKVCSPTCAIDLVEKEKKREFKLETRRLKEKVKTRSEWAREAQAAINRWVRLRDHGKPCISCGRHHKGQYHAGHYKTVGANPEMRFLPVNLRKQCAPCNSHLSGNLINYRKRLVELEGEELVDFLEGPQPMRKYTIEELKEIKQGFNQWANELEKLID